VKQFDIDEVMLETYPASKSLSLTPSQTLWSAISQPQKKINHIGLHPTKKGKN